MQDRLQSLAAALAPIGVISVSVPNWSDKSTWQIWYATGGAVNAAADPNASPIVQSFDITPPAADVLDGWDAITLKITFNHENRIRALEGKAAITAAQFRTALRALP